MRREPLLGFLLLIVVIIVIAANRSDKPDTTNAAVTTTSATMLRGVMPSAPPDEVSFVSVVNNTIKEYNSANGDLARGSVRPSRKNAICRNLNGMYINRWVGKVAKLTTNNEGKGVVYIKINEDITLGTWNNSLSD